MQATVDADIIQEAIRVALRLSPPMTGTVTLQARSSKLYLMSASELSRCIILIPCEVTGKATFAVTTEALKDATVGRKEVVLTYDNSLLKIKNGTYSTSLTTMDAIELDADDQPKDAQTWEVTVDQLQWLKEAVSNVALKPTLNLTAYMPISIKLTSKSAFVSCFDSTHMAFATSKEVTGDVELLLPIETMKAVLETFNKISCTMTVSRASLHVKNQIVDVMIALPDVDEDAVAATDVIAKARESMKADGLSVDVDKKQVIAFLNNARSVATRERSELSIKVEPGSILMIVKTTNGTSRNKLKAATQASTEILIDYEYFDEVVRRSGDNVSFKIVDNFVVFKCPAARSLIALNQSS